MRAQLRKLAMNASQSLGIHPLRVRNPRPAKGGRVVHFLHIGKNAGTQVRNIAQQLDAGKSRVRIVPHSHEVMLRHLPATAEFFFSIRRPASRFKSGFYHRKAEGRPLREIPWSADERLVFQRFEHANDLAEALYAPGADGAAALAAMVTIRHTAQHQVDWFALSGHMLDLRPPVHILRQEHLSNDISVLCDKLNLDVAVQISTDPVQTRVRDYGEIPELSEKARANLARWFAADEQFYDLCEDWLNRTS